MVALTFTKLYGVDLSFLPIGWASRVEYIMVPAIHRHRHEQPPKCLCGVRVSIGSKTWVVAARQSRSCYGGGHLPGAGRPHRPEPLHRRRGEIGKYSYSRSGPLRPPTLPRKNKPQRLPTSTALTRSRWRGEYELRVEMSAFAGRARGNRPGRPSTRATLELTFAVANATGGSPPTTAAGNG